MKKYVWVFFLSFLLCPFVVQAKKIDNLSILIPSCDKYSEVWSPFFTLLFKQWPTLEQKVYLISNNETFKDKRITPITIHNEKSWSDNMLYALEKIPDDYVMIFMEDYFLTSPVDEAKIAKLVKFMRKEQVGYLQIRASSVEQQVSPHPSEKELGYFMKHSPYRNALQVAIWNKKVLKKLLVSGESPWDFEIKGSVRSAQLDEKFMSIVANSPVSYIAAIEKGYWYPTALEFLKKENIPVKMNRLVSGQTRLFLRGPVRDFLSINFVQPIKKMLNQLTEARQDKKMKETS
jgi:hypothetical protein